MVRHSALEIFYSTPNQAEMLTNPGRCLVSKTHAILFFFPAFIAAYYETISGVIPIWFSVGFFSHSPLLVLIIGHLLWRDRGYLLAKHPATSTLAIVGLIGSSFFWLLAWAAGIKVLQIVAAYMVLLFGACTIFGKHSYRIVLPILFLLLFTLPIWQPVQFILQNMATSAVQIALNVIDIPVHVKGNLINIPNGIFEIEDGCSGVGYILVSLSLSGYMSQLDRLGVVQTAWFMLISGVMALFANWIRILLIVLVGYYGGMDQPLVRDHVGFGWVVFFSIFLPYLFLATRFLNTDKVLLPFYKAEKGKLALTTFFIILLSGFAFPITHFALEHTAENGPVIAFKLPGSAGEFESQPSTSKWNPEYPTASDTMLLTYTDQNQSMLHAFVANYTNQKQGSEVIYLGNHLHAKNYNIRDHSTLDTGRSEPAIVTELILERPDGTVMGIWYWYLIGDSMEATERSAKIAQIGQKLLGRGNASIVAISADCAGLKCIGARQNFLKLVSYF